MQIKPQPNLNPGAGTAGPVIAAATGTTPNPSWQPQYDMIESPATAPNTAQGGYGRAVAVSGSTLVVGQPYESHTDTKAIQAGIAFVHRRGHDGKFLTSGETLKHSDHSGGDLFGYSVAVSRDEKTIVVGAPRKNIDPSNKWAGAVYIYRRDDQGQWNEDKLPATQVEKHYVFGTAVAVSEDGNTVVVGAPANHLPGMEHDKASYRPGKAYIYTFANKTWTHQELTSPDADPTKQDGFGFSVAISHKKVVIGAPDHIREVNGVKHSGAAYLFSRKGNKTWSTTGTDLDFTASLADNTGVGGFGWSVAVASNTFGSITHIAVGAFKSGVDNKRKAGTVHTFVVDGNTIKAPETLQAQTITADDFFGWSVAIDFLGVRFPDSPVRLVVGARFDDVDGRIHAGAAHVFEKDNGRSIVWSLQRELELTTSDAESDQKGFAVATSGETIAVGAPSYKKKGAVFIYEDTLMELAQLEDPKKSSSVHNNFGDAVAVSQDGKTVVVGAPKTNNNAGAAYIYQPDNAGLWPLLGKELPIPTRTRLFGASVAINETADTVVVGAPRDFGSSQVNLAGAVYLFHLDSTTGDWVQKLKLAENNAKEEFGQAVAISGDTVVVGAPESGSFYVYDITRNSGSPWKSKNVYQKKLGTSAELGDTVAIQGDVVAVGDPSSMTTVVATRGAQWTEQTLTGGGTSVAISDDGAWLFTTERFAQTVRLYQFDTATSQWTDSGQDLQGASNRFAKRTAASTNRFIAHSDDTWHSGTVHIFKRDPASTSPWSSAPKTISGLKSQYLAYALDVSDKTMVLGSKDGRAPVYIYGLRP